MLRAFFVLPIQILLGDFGFWGYNKKKKEVIYDGRSD